MRNEKITPLYERLSRDDELQGESNSIAMPFCESAITSVSSFTAIEA